MINIIIVYVITLCLITLWIDANFNIYVLYEHK